MILCNQVLELVIDFWLHKDFILVTPLLWSKDRQYPLVTNLFINYYS